MVDNQHWLDRWREDRIGFHEGEVNRHLRHWMPQFAPPPGSQVFLPLCGKALDILWCAQQGYEVVGIELSQIAVEAFFAENEIEFEHEDGDRFGVYRAGSITLLQGDFFDMRASDLADCRLVYDRAALIAMEGELRQRYYAHMREIVPRGCDMLLITLEYDTAEMRGPPFSVPRDEVLQEYNGRFEIELLDHESIIDERPRWRKVGLTALEESVFRLRG